MMDWHPIRWVFLVAGIALAAYAYSISEVALGLLAFILAYQAVMNVGCIKFCYPHKKDSNVPVNTTDEIIYEEIL